MKKLIFNEHTIVENPNYISNLNKIIFKIPGLFSFFEFKDISIKSSIEYTKKLYPEQVFLKESENISNFTAFLLHYIYNILHNNKAAILRKKPPYEIIIRSKICYKPKQFQCYLFVDDAIFGLVIGSKFKNVTNLIRTLYPISAKMDFSNEIRFFPISREPDHFKFK